MNTESLEATVFTQHHSDINGHGVWHYLIATPIGRFNVVDYEAEGQEIVRREYGEDCERAEKAYRSACKKALSFKPYARS